MVRSNRTVAVPPGATIREQLADRGMSQKEFAIRIGLSEKHVSRLINGEVILTPDVARRLEMVLEIPAEIWGRLEASYRESLARVEDENAMGEDINYSKIFPYSEMVKNGWVPPASRPEDKVVNLRKFFEVARFIFLENQKLEQISFRRLSIDSKVDCSLLVWAQAAKHAARTIETSPIDVDLLKEQLETIRGMSLMCPKDFCPKLVHLLSKCGIALVFLPHMEGSFLHGATFLNGNRIVIGMTVRGKYSDRFWFSMMHELAHVVLGHVFKDGGSTKEDEDDADMFAERVLIPDDDFSRFVEKNDFSKTSILDFSDLIGISPSIVVGRLQKEKLIPFSKFNEMKKLYESSTFGSSSI